MILRKENFSETLNVFGIAWKLTQKERAMEMFCGLTLMGKPQKRLNHIEKYTD